MKKTPQRPPYLPPGTLEGLFVLAGLILIILIISLINLFADPDTSQETAAETTVFTETTVPETDWQDITAVEFPVSIGSGISLTGLYAVNGTFPEDGSDTPGENYLCAAFRNDSAKMLEYMTVTLKNGELSYSFSVSTLPAGETVYAFEKNAAEVPESWTEFAAESQYQLFFTEEPDSMEADLQCTVHDGSIDVQNISGKRIDREIQVYYKNTLQDAYYGGITYMLRIPDGLNAGETYNGYASHADEEHTEVMFVKYGEK